MSEVILSVCFWGVILLEAYVMGLSGLGWQYNPLVLELNRDKGFLLRGQVSLFIYKGRRSINLIKQELEVLLLGRGQGPRSPPFLLLNPNRCHNTYKVEVLPANKI